jgi:YgiT-type zinc finger domain-containing protein
MNYEGKTLDKDDRDLRQRRQNEEKAMKCHNCGGEFESVTTDLPFKTGAHSIIIIKDLPVMQCGNCNEFMIEDQIMERVDAIIGATEKNVEVEVLRFAA